MFKLFLPVCEAVQHAHQNLIVHRGHYAYVILNRYPYTSGHLMVVPFEHQSNLEDLKAEARAEIIDLVSQCLHILKHNYHAQGFNVGANIGSAAGAGVEAHGLKAGALLLGVLP